MICFLYMEKIHTRTIHDHQNWLAICNELQELSAIIRRQSWEGSFAVSVSECN